MPRKGRSDTPPAEAYENPLASRYASPEMLQIFSAPHRYGLWRRIWVALATAEAELGLPITQKQLRAMQKAVDDIDFDAVREHEQRTRHDVMAHIHAFGAAAPAAAGVIHLGATSMDVVDNADLVLMREALDLLCRRLVGVVRVLADFCRKYADLPTLGFTHLQPAQLTTVGKRATLWLSDLCRDLEALSAARDGLKCRGLRGATGTQASFLNLLGTPAKVKRLEKAFANRLGFKDCYPVCGQTYSRKIDIEVMSLLGSFAAGAHKICNDIRLLAMLKEIEEPFAKTQVGSSAMAYKRNPMRSERTTGLARYLMSLVQSPFQTAAAQMFERTLDDSSNKRLVVPEAFLAADAIAVLLHSILDGLVVYPQMINARLMAELPFIATEDIMMEAAKRGGNRQQLHERIRQHSHAAGAEVKLHGRPNDLIERLQADDAFAGLKWKNLLDPRRYVGLAPQQTRDFLKSVATPLLRKHGKNAIKASDVKI